MDERPATAPGAPAISGAAAAYLPDRLGLESLRAASLGCRACPLWRRGTQTVFGEGKKSARVMFVGEQPGNEEDLAGKPFVGPAGRVLAEALEAAGIERSATFVTNAVKHFKWLAKGKVRVHQKPTAGEVAACFPWLQSEIAVVRPPVIVCLGSTAAQALLGRAFRVTQDRGKFVPSPHARWVMATVHPSSILRIPTSEERRAARAQFVLELKSVAKVLASLPDGR